MSTETVVKESRFTDRQPFTVTAKQASLKYGGESSRGNGFSCKLCGKHLAEGDSARWIYCNSTPGARMCNFFVCGGCDGTDEDVISRGNESYALAVKLAKQWNIYGPDWQSGR